MKQNKNIYYHFISQKNKLKGIMHQTYKPKMSNKVKDIDMKKSTHYFFQWYCQYKSFVLNNIKIDEKPDKNIFIYYIGYVKIQNM